MPKKRDYQNVWEWLLEMGPLKAFVLLIVIDAAVGGIVLRALKWYVERS